MPNCFTTTTTAATAADNATNAISVVAAAAPPPHSISSAAATANYSICLRFKSVSTASNFSIFFVKKPRRKHSQQNVRRLIGKYQNSFLFL